MEHAVLIALLHVLLNLWEIAVLNYSMLIRPLAWPNVFFAACLVHSPIDDDDIQPGVFLKNFDVVQGPAIDEDAVGIIANLDLAHFVGSHEQFRHAVRGGDERLVGGEPKKFLKVSKVPGV